MGAVPKHSRVGICGLTAGVAGPASPEFAVLALEPWRVSAATATALARGERAAVWRADALAEGVAG